tara:strand:+ start:529 stop:1848 length:1320 start_codon:yes stop_codon:yes gene_type:complete
MKTLILGFTTEQIKSLKKRFEIKYIVSHSEMADENWNDVYNLRYEFSKKNFSRRNISSSDLDAMIKKYQKYVEMSSRQYVTIHPHNSEIYNAFIIQIYWIDYVINENKIELIIFEDFPHEGFDYIVYEYAKLKKINIIMTNQSLFPNRFWITNSINGFGKFLNEPNIEKKINIDFSIPKKWFYMTYEANQPLVKTQYYSLFSAFKDLLKKPSYLPATLMRYYYNREYQKNVNLGLKKESSISEVYIYVALHLQPEMCVSTLGGENLRYSDQLYVLETLRNIIPENIQIVCKDNPKQSNLYRDKNFYRRLYSIPNLILLDGGIDGQTLISKSLGVAILSGTTGWEAVNMGKPCLTFGFCWYNTAPGVLPYSETNFNFDLWINTKKTSRIDLQNWLNDLGCKMGVGIVDFDYIVLKEDYNEVENAENIAESIKKYMVEKFL